MNLLIVCTVCMQMLRVWLMCAFVVVANAVYADAAVNFATNAVAVGADAEHTDVECVVIVFCS